MPDINRQVFGDLKVDEADCTEIYQPSDGGPILTLNEWVGSTETGVATAELTAAAYNAFDRLGRAHGVDATFLAKELDLGKVLSTLGCMTKMVKDGDLTSDVIEEAETLLAIAWPKKEEAKVTDHLDPIPLTHGILNIVCAVMARKELALCEIHIPGGKKDWEKVVWEYALSLPLEKEGLHTNAYTIKTLINHAHSHALDLAKDTTYDKLPELFLFNPFSEGIILAPKKKK